MTEPVIFLDLAPLAHFGEVLPRAKLHAKLHQTDILKDAVLVSGL